MSENSPDHWWPMWCDLSGHKSQTSFGVSVRSCRTRSRARKRCARLSRDALPTYCPRPFLCEFWKTERAIDDPKINKRMQKMFDVGTGTCRNNLCDFNESFCKANVWKSKAYLTARSKSTSVQLLILGRHGCFICCASKTLWWMMHANGNIPCDRWYGLHTHITFPQTHYMVNETWVFMVDPKTTPRRGNTPTVCQHGNLFIWEVLVSMTLRK